MPSLLFIDTETTALGHNAAVIEIAAIAYIDGVRHKPFQSYVRPHEGALLSPKAFEVNRIDINKIWTFPEASMVIKDLLDYIDSFECIFSISGQNVKFDVDMLFRFFCKNGMYSSYLNRFSPKGICTLAMAKSVYKNKRNKPDGFSLEKLCAYHKIELKNAHSALPDIEATIDLYEKLLPEYVPQHKEDLKFSNYQEMRRKYMDSKYVQINPEGDIFLTREAMNNDIIRRFIFTELDSIYETKM